MGLGAQAMAADLGLRFELDLETDSSAAKGVASRRGVGKIRHLHTPLLWLQGRVRRKELKVWKIDGKTNEADIGTKALNGEALDAIMKRLDFVFEAQASGQALQATVG